MTADGCRACGAPDHPSGCAVDLPNVIASATEHEHQWIDVSEMADRDRRELCWVCGETRMVPR